jgi:Sugar (and other) transporter
VAVQLIPAGLLALMLPLIKESPVWLLKKGREQDAYRVYSYLRNLPADHVYIAEDVSFVRGQIEGERAIGAGGGPGFFAFLRGALKESCMKGMRNRYVLVFLMFMWQAWSGAAAINYCGFLRRPSFR